ncbi:NUDIX domain-containing protein [Marininema mesophilum]|uniref:NUDIX domain-containing protein n=1 Tax=Marininema mesophilum TaxID=1048340 RepID=A0A1H3CGP8_9BACL|nr:NUDIX domain-containing protein [Marininema mesophilum]SDX53331.1 NUDIX domain-containing protein [Marininema mesophilum]
MNQLSKKVLGYIVRKNNNNWELLLFEHAAIPEAGIQIPGGTVEDFEDDLSAALLREIREESGLEDLTVLTEILTEKFYHDIKKECQERHFFVLITSSKKNKWSHTVNSSGKDSGLQFNYYWKKLHTVCNLAANQHIAVKHVLNFLEKNY